MLEIKGFITNLGKYNKGELIGEWVTFPVDEDEIEEIFKRININDEYEEYFFTDWETDFDNDFGEYVSIEDINEIAEKLEEWDEDLFNAACEEFGMNEILDNDPDDYYLLSDVKDDYDLGYYWIEESGCYNTKDLGNLSRYIDYEAFGRDVRLESYGGFSSYGWVEKR